eukprot:TRINITY_DN17165_c0_g1_i1.p1 TRINITY_DN17165_c0_g1~~TRINITY_DN17165_c0_g1_i1.p1  ORF type:complete len:107 (+),score=10.41 TRINITY_DN17165_c0_g1_i1:107-427(+)
MQYSYDVPGAILEFSQGTPGAHFLIFALTLTHSVLSQLEGLQRPVRTFSFQLSKARSSPAEMDSQNNTIGDPPNESTATKAHSYCYSQCCAIRCNRRSLHTPHGRL